MPRSNEQDGSDASRASPTPTISCTQSSADAAHDAETVARSWRGACRVAVELRLLRHRRRLLGGQLERRAQRGDARPVVVLG
jgi:hypothetical protein